MIINIRGTSGSGKTFTVKGLMAKFAEVVPLEVDGRISVYHCSRGVDYAPVYVVGNYHMKSGGCDRLGTPQFICDLISKYAAFGDVIFEGLLVSRTVGRYEKLDRASGGNFIWAFLDTPLELCIERVNARRAATGNDKPFNPEGLTETWNYCQRYFKRVTAGGMDARWLSSHNSVETVWGWLNR